MKLAYPFCVARIAEDSPRAVLWLKVFGKLEVDLLRPYPVLVQFPDGTKLCYLGDYDALDEAGKARFVQHLVEHNGFKADEIAADLARPDSPVDARIPLIADGVTVLFQSVLVEGVTVS